MGKPLGEATAEVRRTVDMTRHFAGAVKHAEGASHRLGSDREQAWTIRIPLGVVVAITPWNFPLMIPNWKIASALVHGNAVIFKPAESAPLSAAALTQCYLDAGVPAAALTLLLGRGPVVGPTLLESTDVDAVTFTGSTQVGRMIVAESARTGKKVQAEMGGKNAVVVMPDAHLDDAVASVVLAGFGTSGQRCTSSSRVLVHEEVREEFTDRLVHATKALVTGPGLRPGVTVGPLASQQAMEGALRLLEKAISEGAEVVVGGGRLTSGELGHGYFIEPTILNADSTGTAFSEELFGPVVSIHQFSNLDEAIEMNNAVRYGLSAAIYTNNLTSAHRFIREVDTGMVHVNRPTVGAEAHLPFGGAKDSAYGIAELGASADFFTRTRSAHVRW